MFSRTLGIHQHRRTNICHASSVQVYTYACTYVCMHASMPACMHSCLYVYMTVSLCVSMYVSEHAYVYVRYMYSMQY